MFRQCRYWAATCFWALLALLFFGVLIKSFACDAMTMLLNTDSPSSVHTAELRQTFLNTWDWLNQTALTKGNMLGLICGFAAYAVFLLFFISPKVRHNLDWFMHFTHELTHTLVALVFFRRIEEFLVSGRDCHVKYQKSRIGYVPITLSPYCIPIYTFMLFPFRFFGYSPYMFVFDVMIAFTYCFHVHSFIRYTRYSQSDIEGCGLARSTAFIVFVHCAVLALILSIPKGGTINATCRVFWEYPYQLVTNPVEYFGNIVESFGEIVKSFQKLLHII